MIIGTIAGDIIGSTHEFKSVPTKVKDFGPLFIDGYAQKSGGFALSLDGHGHRVVAKISFY